MTLHSSAGPTDRAPVISAHRGGSETAPPGTYAAYRGALAAGAGYLEFDVRVTADGELVAFHDARLRSGQLVAAASYAELCQAAGYEVPTTSRIFELLAGRDGGHGGGAHIDLKDAAAGPQVVAQALAILDPSRVIVTSRDPATVAAVKSRFPEVGAGLTIGGDAAQSVRHAVRWARPARWAEAVAGAGADWAAVQQRLARSGVLAKCRDRGVRTMVWTVNGDARLRRWLASLDVDVVVTDRPGRAAELRAIR
ncbi:MAG TPA: glycerophosphodiester phosphodiesterase [Streptosporangiaceae bacterium]